MQRSDGTYTIGAPHTPFVDAVRPADFDALTGEWVVIEQRWAPVETILSSHHSLLSAADAMRAISAASPLDDGVYIARHRS